MLSIVNRKSERYSNYGTFRFSLFSVNIFNIAFELKRLLVTRDVDNIQIRVHVELSLYPPPPLYTENIILPRRQSGIENVRYFCFFVFFIVFTRPRGQKHYWDNAKKSAGSHDKIVGKKNVNIVIGR